MISIRVLNTEALESIKGGTSAPIWVGVAIAALIIFIAGVIEGIVNPERCNE